MPEREPAILRGQPADAGGGADADASAPTPAVDGETDGTPAADRDGADAEPLADSQHTEIIDKESTSGDLESDRGDSGGEPDDGEPDDGDAAIPAARSDDAADTDAADTEIDDEAARDATDADATDDDATDDATARDPLPVATPLPRPTAAAAARNAPVFYVAGFWRRLAGAAVDLAIILPVALLLSWLAGAVTGIHLPDGRYQAPDRWLDLLLVSDPALIGGVGLILAIATLYVLIFQIVQARTPGMRLLRVRVIDHYGDAPSTGRAAARATGYLAAIATLGLGFLWIGFDSEKRGLHDWLSGTYVVKVEG